MVAMGHVLCVCFRVCGETTKNKEGSKIVNVSYSRAYDVPTLAIMSVLTTQLISKILLV
jgi:hypothetical protein